MSNTWLNIRFGSRHFQILKDRPYIQFTINPSHARGTLTRQAYGWKWFEIY